MRTCGPIASRSTGSHGRRNDRDVAQANGERLGGADSPVTLPKSSTPERYIGGILHEFTQRYAVGATRAVLPTATVTF